MSRRNVRARRLGACRSQHQLAAAQSALGGHWALLVKLERRVLLSIAPAAGTTSMLDHSSGFADTSNLRLNGSSGLPAIGNVSDSAGNSYSSVLQLSDGKAGEVSTAFSDPPPDGTAPVLGIDTFDT